MRLADIRFLYDYDRWATRRILDAASGVDDTTWSAPNAIGERGLGGILVHHLGAHQRWRHGLSGSAEEPRPEKGPLPAPAELAQWWEAEWLALDAWLATMVEAIPYWQMLAHVVNHGTQHRAEAAALLTTAGRSPGDLDMIFFSEAVAAEAASAAAAAPEADA